MDRHKTLTEKLYFTLLAAGLLGSIMAFPAQANEKISGEANYESATYDVSIRGDDFIGWLSIANSKVTLTGQGLENNGDLITVNGESPDQNLRVDLVGNVKLVLGSESKDYKIAGGIYLQGNNSISVAKGTVKMNSWISEEGLSIDTTLEGHAEIGNLEGFADSTFQFGNNEKAAHVAIDRSVLKGGTMFLDPIWSETGDNLQEHGSRVAIASTTVDGRYYVGQNSTLSFGTSSYEDSTNVFNKTGLTWGQNDIGSALYIHKSVNLDDTRLSAIYLDPTLTAERFDSERPVVSPLSVTMTQGSLLMVKGSEFDLKENITAPAAINNVVSTITDEGKLFVLDAQNRHTYKIFAGDNLTNTRFDKIFTNNTLLTLNRVEDDNKLTEFKVVANVDETNPLISDSPLSNVIINSLEEEGPTADFINAIANDQINPTEEDRENAINSLANFGEVAGATHGTYTAARTFMDLAQDHLSIAHHKTEMHKDLWANYVHNRESVSDLSLANMKADYEGSYNTFIVGSDLYVKDNLVLGVAATYGTGKLSSRNSRASTKNDTTYYGASIYGRKINGKTAYLTDISYLRGESDITQRNSGQVLTGKPKTNAYSFGIKAEQKFEKDFGTLIPYAGFRYMHLSQGTYTNSAGFTYDQEDQNLFLIPMGVKLTSERRMGNWTVKPMAEVGMIINTGDKDTKQTVSVGSGENSMDYTILNGTFLLGKLGVQAEKENVTLGVSYQYQKSADTSDNRFQVNVGYRF